MTRLTVWRARLARALPLLGVLALAMLPYRAFFTSQVPAGRDLLYYFYPLKAHLVEAVRGGEVPWVDRYRWGGLPLLGSPGVAAFDPGNVLFLLLPLGVAAKAWMLLRIGIGIAGFAAFSRRLGLSNGAAAVAGLMFGLGGATVSLVPFLSSSSALSLLPWVGAFALDVRRERSGGAALRLGVSFGLLALAALPELLLHSVLIAFVLVLPARGEAHPPLPRLARGMALAGLIGLGLGAAALVPGAAAAFDSVRGPGGGTNLKFASADALPPERLVELFSDFLVADWAAGTPDPSYTYPYLPSLTPGRVALLLALVGLLSARGARVRALALAALGLLLALGPATPVFAFLARLVPPLAAMRYPEKHAILACFAFAWLAATGLGALEKRLGERALRVVLPLLALAVLVDRASTARRLVELAPGDVLTRPPELLDSVPAAAADEPPPRLFHRDSYAPVPAFDVRDLAAANRASRRSLGPEYATLFGRGYVFELDYDLTLPLAAFEWTRLLTRAIPSVGPLPHRMLRAAGVQAEVFSEKRGEGLYVPRLAAYSDPRPPYRFARRAVFDADGRRLFGTMLSEGVDLDTAYVVSSEAPRALAKGRVLAVSDRPSALSLDVEVPEGGDGVLMLYRLRSATAEATLDGRPVETLDVFMGFTGLRVPPGRHSLRLRPAVVWVKIGATVTGCTLLALVLISVRARRAPAIQ